MLCGTLWPPGSGSAGSRVGDLGALFRLLRLPTPGMPSRADKMSSVLLGAFDPATLEVGFLRVDLGVGTGFRLIEPTRPKDFSSIFSHTVVGICALSENYQEVVISCYFFFLSTAVEFLH